MGSTHLGNSSRRANIVRQSIYCGKDIVHREQHLCTYSSVAVLPMAHQRSGRDEPQTSHLRRDESECYSLPCQHLDLDLPMLVSLDQHYVAAMTLTMSRPISATWNTVQNNAKCVPEGIFITTVGALLTAMDFVVNILPLPIVARLNVAFQQRLAATVLLSLGTIATAAGIVREVYVYRAFIGTKDSTWGALPLWICADVEIYVGLVSSVRNLCRFGTRLTRLCSCVLAFPHFALSGRKQPPGFHSKKLVSCHPGIRRVIRIATVCLRPCHGTNLTRTSFSTVLRLSTLHQRCSTAGRRVTPQALPLSLVNRTLKPTPA